MIDPKVICDSKIENAPEPIGSEAFSCTLNREIDPLDRPRQSVDPLRQVLHPVTRYQKFHRDHKKEKPRQLYEQSGAVLSKVPELVISESHINFRNVVLANYLRGFIP